MAPALVAAAIAAAARLLPESFWRRSAALPALALGYAAGHVAVAGVPSLPPTDTTQGLFHLALAAGALGLLEVSAGAAWRQGIAGVMAVGLTLALALHPLVRHQWSRGQAALRLAALAVAALLLWWGCRAVAERLAPGAAHAAWIAVFAGTATLLLLARTALLAQLASSVVIVLLVLAVTMRGPDTLAAGVALPFLAPMLFAFVLNGFFYAELGAPAAAALAASPLAAALAFTAGRRGPRVRAVAAVAGVVVLLAPFVAVAAIGYAADDRGYYDYGE
jgi:hypothetical protein